MNDQKKTTNPLEQKIKDKFKLFQGMRSQEEDQKIYDKVMGLCFDETMLFLSENLTENGRENLKKEIDEQTSEEDKFRSLTRYLSAIENSEKKLGMRIDGFLNNLLFSSIK